jgi:hypothetical protein
VRAVLAWSYAFKEAADTLIPPVVSNVAAFIVVAFIVAALIPVVTQTLPTIERFELGVAVKIPTNPVFVIRMSSVPLELKMMLPFDPVPVEMVSALPVTIVVIFAVAEFIVPVTLSDGIFDMLLAELTIMVFATSIPFLTLNVLSSVAI